MLRSFKSFCILKCRPGSSVCWTILGNFSVQRPKGSWIRSCWYMISQKCISFQLSCCSTLKSNTWNCTVTVQNMHVCISFCFIVLLCVGFCSFLPWTFIEMYMIWCNNMESEICQTFWQSFLHLIAPAFLQLLRKVGVTIDISVRYLLSGQGLVAVVTPWKAFWEIQWEIANQISNKWSRVMASLCNRTLCHFPSLYSSND